MDLKAGDVVILKSGGPKMTIQNIGEYTSGVKAYCTWFVSGELKEGYFSLESLVKI